MWCNEGYYFRRVWTISFAPPKHQYTCTFTYNAYTVIPAFRIHCANFLHAVQRHIKKCVPSALCFAVIPYWSIRMFSPVCVWDRHPMLETCSKRLNWLSYRLQWLLLRLWQNCRSCCSSEWWLFAWWKVWWWHRCIWQRSWLYILIVFVDRRRARAFLNWPSRTKQTTQKFSFKGVRTVRPMTIASSVFHVCLHLYEPPLKIA